MNKRQLLQEYNIFLTRKTGEDSSFFEQCLQEFLQEKERSYELSTDGASAGNPGPAGAGICIKYKDEIIFKKSYALGHATNNEAEYWALILGLFHLYYIDKEASILHLTDSELLARQIQGIYKVKHPRMKPLWKTAQNLLQLFMGYEVKSLPRNHLEAADELAKKGAQTTNVQDFREIKKQLVAEGFLEERA